MTDVRLDRSRIDRVTTEDEKLLRRRDTPEFLDTDPWRALRILVRVRRGLRRDGRGRAGGDRLRLGPDAGRARPIYELARTIGRSWPRRATRSSPAAGPGSWRRPTAAARRAAACRSAATSSCPTSRALNPYVDLGVEFRYFFARKVDVREVRRRVRHPARRLRDARRAVRGADPHPDRQGPALPGDPGGLGLLGRAARLGPRAVLLAGGRRRPRRTSTCCASPTTRTRRGHAHRRVRQRGATTRPRSAAAETQAIGGGPGPTVAPEAD